MSKARAAILAEYSLFKILSLSLGLIPSWLVGVFAGALAVMVYALVGSARRVALTNLNLVFGESKTSREKRAIAQSSLRSVAMTAVEMIKTSKRSGDWILEKTVPHGFERLTEALKKGRGVVVCAAHYSNWEWIALWAAQKGVKVNAVVRLLDNPLVDREVEGLRLSKGVRIIPRKEAPREGIRALERGEALALMVDQNAAVGGVFVPFFGHLASTMRGAAFFSQKLGSPVLCVHSHRKENGCHDIFFSEELAMSGDEVRDLTMINAYFERVVREAPEEYFWVHPRWKKRPPGQTSFYQDVNI